MKSDNCICGVATGILLKGVGFSLAPGQALQLLWPNGTGKTSLLRCIAGFLYAEEGEVLWEGTRSRATAKRSTASWPTWGMNRH